MISQCLFSDELSKRRYVGTLPDPVKDVFVRIDPQLFAGLGNGQESIVGLGAFFGDGMKADISFSSLRARRQFGCIIMQR